MKDGDSINILRGSKQDQSNVLLSGEFLYPGYYDISAGQTISEIINQAGGFTELAYPEGAVFTRESVKEQQKESFEKNAQNLERSLVDAVSSGSQIDGEAYIAINEFIEKLREQEPIEDKCVYRRIFFTVDPKLDFILQMGFNLFLNAYLYLLEKFSTQLLAFQRDLSIQSI